MTQAADGTLAVAAFATWLATESLGLVMLRGWLATGGARPRSTQPEAVSLPVLLGHAGLAFSGFVCWIAFLANGARIFAWISVGLLGPAIGLGISTVTVWTPYPARRPPDGGDREPQSRVLSEESLKHILADEQLTGAMIDDLLRRNLGSRPPGRRARADLLASADLRALIPMAHGVLAIATFLLATLAAITAL
jgi:hypothetical protein